MAKLEPDLRGGANKAEAGLGGRAGHRGRGRRRRRRGSLSRWGLVGTRETAARVGDWPFQPLPDTFKLGERRGGERTRPEVAVRAPPAAEVVAIRFKRACSTPHLPPALSVPNLHSGPRSVASV